MASGDQIEIDAYLEMLASERGASQNTLDAYRRDLQDFAVFLDARGGSIRGASRDEIAAYMEHLGGRDFRPHRARGDFRPCDNSISSWRQTASSGQSRGGAKAPKLGRPLPEDLSVAEVGPLMEVAASIAGRNGRDLARAVSFMRYSRCFNATGMRVSELVSLPRNVLAGDPAC